MKFRLFTVAVLTALFALFAPSFVVHAQAATVAFSMSDVTGVTQAVGFTYRIRTTVPGSPEVTSTLTGVTCTATATAGTVNCQAPLPSANSGALTAGASSTLSSAFNSTSPESVSSPFQQGTAAPTGFRITR